MPPSNPTLFPDTSQETITAHCDGGARGNPGPAGFGAHITDSSGHVIAELSEFLGIRTNNFAEYSGLLASLQYALDHGHRALRVISDSELMVKQIQGKYKVNSPDLKPLWQEAKSRIARLDRFEIAHALRHKNKEADRLANEAMDRGMKRGPDPTDRGMRRGPDPTDRGMRRGPDPNDRGMKRGTATQQFEVGHPEHSEGPASLPQTPKTSAEFRPVSSTPAAQASVQSLCAAPHPAAIPYPNKSTAPPPPRSFDPRATSSTTAPETCHPERSEGPASLPQTPPPTPTMLRGFARDGVIHILGPHTLSNGTFVKIIPE